MISFTVLSSLWITKQFEVEFRKREIEKECRLIFNVVLKYLSQKGEKSDFLSQFLKEVIDTTEVTAFYINYASKGVKIELKELGKDFNSKLMTITKEYEDWEELGTTYKYLFQRSLGLYGDYIRIEAEFKPDFPFIARYVTYLTIYLLLSVVIVIFLLYGVLTRFIVVPLRELKRGSEEITRGNFDVKVELKGGSEFIATCAAFNTMVNQIKEEREKLKKRIEELNLVTNELKETQSSLIRATKLATVGTLASGLAHELGNPLSAIIGISELLMEEDLKDDIKNYIKLIHREARRTDRTIKQLLDYARYKPKQIEPISVDEVIEASISLLGVQKIFKGVVVNTILEEELPLIKGDKDMITQLLVNLLLNAAQAMNGEGIIEIRVERVKEGSDRLRLAVEDSGPGVPDSIREKIFEPFFTTKDPGRGVGLGLAICEKIVTEFGGSIYLDREKSKLGGAKFVVELPIHKE